MLRAFADFGIAFLELLEVQARQLGTGAKKVAGSIAIVAVAVLAGHWTLRGFGAALKHVLRPPITVNYPEQHIDEHPLNALQVIGCSTEHRTDTRFPPVHDPGGDGINAPFIKEKGISRAGL